MDRTDCLESFFGIFSRYLELPMLELHVLGVVGILRGNSTNLISTNVSGLQLFPSQCSTLVDRTDCCMLCFGVFP